MPNEDICVDGEASETESEASESEEETEVEVPQPVASSTESEKGTFFAQFKWHVLLNLGFSMTSFSMWWSPTKVWSGENKNEILI